MLFFLRRYENNVAYFYLFVARLFALSAPLQILLLQMPKAEAAGGQIAFNLGSAAGAYCRRDADAGAGI